MNKKIVIISVIVLIICVLLIPASFILNPRPTIISGGYMYTVRLFAEDESTSRGNYFDLSSAKSVADENKVYGYKVFNKFGDVVYYPYDSELVSDLMREGKWVADYIRDNGFHYGDAPINPAMNCDAKTVSCDRLVGWILYRVAQSNNKYASYLEQPQTQGIVVSKFTAWCEEHNFKRIESVDELKAGDIVFVNPQGMSSVTATPGHVFLCAGDGGFGNYYRYDGGSDTRIQSTQPFLEPINNFMYAYRPE